MATGPVDAEVRARAYIPVFVALAVLMLLSVSAGGLDIPRSGQVFLIMLYAVGKAALVALYYMHVRYEPRLFFLVPVVPLLMVLALLLALVLV